MELLNKSISKAVERPVKVLQFGEETSSEVLLTT